MLLIRDSPFLRLMLLSHQVIARQGVFRDTFYLLPLGDLKDPTEAEKDIFHAKMNRYLYEAAEQTTADSNIAKYKREKMKEARKLTESGKKRPIPNSPKHYHPHLRQNSRRYRTLAIKWDNGHLPANA